MGQISDSQIIILEGADGVGKTTLARELVEAQNRKLIHAGPPTSDDWHKEYIDPVVPLAAKQSLVLDRWHLGEAVWPGLMGRDSLFKGKDDISACHQELVEAGAFTILLVRPTSEIAKELLARHKDAVEEEEPTIPGVVKNLLNVFETADTLEVALAGQAAYVRVFPALTLDRLVMTTLPSAREMLGLV